MFHDPNADPIAEATAIATAGGWWSYWMLCFLLLIGGCDGCRQGPATADNQGDVPQAEFTSKPPLPFPADNSFLAGGIKPGHWFSASIEMKSNRGDRRGQMRSSLALPVFGADGIPTGRVEPFSMESVRPAVLPKGQSRQFEYRLLAPLPESIEQRRVDLRSRLEISGQVSSLEGKSQPYELLAEQEYFFVILTNRPERFARLKVADWVRPVVDEASFKTPENNYRIVIPPTDDLLPLPESMLDWTSVAVLFWDDLEAETLTPAQMVAIADWIHFGGTLIVNGSAAAESLGRSSLAPWLAVKPTGSLEMDPDLATELLENWSVRSDRSTVKQIALIRDGIAPIVVEGQLNKSANMLPRSGDLVLSQLVGRGQLVQTKFDMTADWMTGWASYDSFFNNVILRRPRRQIKATLDALEEYGYRQVYADSQSAKSTAVMNTRFRLASRDAVVRAPAARTDSARAASASESPIQDPLIRDPPYAFNNGYTARPYSGIAGWTDTSDLLTRYRTILREESGIEIPARSLVLKSLAVYLLALIPLNYLVFRLIGRLEYAWMSVPVIAIIGAIAIARVARLDIGFARSQTELAVVEVQPNYARGHLSRMVAIYNSLSTSYTVAFDSADAVAAPVNVLANPDTQQTSFRWSFDEGPSLVGFSIDSNQTSMMHAEQIIDLGGTVDLVRDVDGGDRLQNRTRYDLGDAVIVQRSMTGQVSVAVLGTVSAQASKPVQLVAPEQAGFPTDLPLRAAELIDGLATKLALGNGEVRLVARIDTRLPGMTIQPAATQVTSQTILLAHLEHQPLPPPLIDVNLVADLRPVQTDLPESSDLQDEADNVTQ